MTNALLNRAIARATGESVSEIKRRGFQLLTHRPVERDPEDMIVDWDKLALQRNVGLIEQRWDDQVFI